MSRIPDISDTERWIVKNTLRERYDRDLEIQYADSEIRLLPSDRELTSCPVIYWQDDKDCHFIIFKTGDRNYRAQFFYRAYQQYGTDVREYDDLSECAVSLLQVQADHYAKEQGEI